ncbi:hypothetical protein HY58_15100 [Flavihumibacter sp. ZG627]|nr:hypothetical protein HY58_15100 [Flavihumibacter sp. ZG627]
MSQLNHGMSQFFQIDEPFILFKMDPASLKLSYFRFIKPKPVFSFTLIFYFFIYRASTDHPTGILRYRRHLEGTGTISSTTVGCLNKYTD